MSVEILQLLVQNPVLLSIFVIFALIAVGIVFYVVKSLITAIRGSGVKNLKIGNLIEWRASQKQKEGEPDAACCMEPDSPSSDGSLSSNQKSHIEICIRTAVQETASYFNRRELDREDTFEEQMRNSAKVLTDTRLAVTSLYTDAVYKEIKDRAEATASRNYFERVLVFHFGDIQLGLWNAFRVNHLGDKNDEQFSEYVSSTSGALVRQFLYNILLHERPVYTTILKRLEDEIERIVSVAVRGVLSSARESAMEHKRKTSSYLTLLGINLNSGIKRSCPSLPAIDVADITELTRPRH